METPDREFTAEEYTALKWLANTAFDLSAYAFDLGGALKKKCSRLSEEIYLFADYVSDVMKGETAPLPWRRRSP